MNLDKGIALPLQLFLLQSSKENENTNINAVQWSHLRVGVDVTGVTLAHNVDFAILRSYIPEPLFFLANVTLVRHALC